MNNDIPNTLRALESKGETGRPRIFEPALRHFQRVYKLGDYLSPSLHERLELELIRAEVRAHLLQLVAQSRWKEHLVLRGSVLMQAWFGENARDPKDIDWVFQPKEVKLGDPLCELCFDELANIVDRNSRTPNAQILTGQIATDDIWTYERAAGRRIVFPYQSEKGGQREIQMDIVWNEELIEPPMLTNLPGPDGSEIEVWAATKELSLAWKLLWLATDGYAQGKDLYDAVLLAENIRLPYDLLRRTLMSYDENSEYLKHTIEDFTDLYIDWSHFKNEFPWIEGDVQQWHQRLIAALVPVFANSSG